MALTDHLGFEPYVAASRLQLVFSSQPIEVSSIEGGHIISASLMLPAAVKSRAGDLVDLRHLEWKRASKKERAWLRHCGRLFAIVLAATFFGRLDLAQAALTLLDGEGWHENLNVLASRVANAFSANDSPLDGGFSRKAEAILAGTGQIIF